MRKTAVWLTNGDTHLIECENPESMAIRDTGLHFFANERMKTARAVLYKGATEPEDHTLVEDMLVYPWANILWYETVRK